MKILIESERWNLIETKNVKYVGNYQIIDKSIENYHMPYIFDDYEDALKKFNKIKFTKLNELINDET